MSRAGKKYWCIVCAAAMVTAGFIGRESARASDYIGANGSDWSVSSNWSAGVPSGGAASANISLAPLVPFNIFMNFPYTAGSALGSVNINSSTAQMLTVTMNSAANLFSGDEFIGNTGKATFAQSSGTNSVSGGLLIGYNVGASGTYNLSSTGNVYVNVYETVGLSGNGSFNQTGGTNTVGTAGSGQFRVAENSSSTASYSLSAGSFTVNGSAWIGNAGNGTFTQSGGTATFNGTEIIGYLGTGNYNHSGGGHSAIDQYIGWGSGTTGTYTLSSTGSGAGGLAVSGTQYVGYSGTGTMNQTGGSESTNVLSVGSLGGSHGTYALSGSGNATAGSAYIGGSSSAAGGMGVVNIGGGGMTVSGELRVWNTPGTAVNLSGGSLSVGSLNPDSNPSRFNWTGGNLNVTAGAVIVDSTVPANLPSSLTLSATKSLSAVISGSATAEYIGYAGTGAVTQNGGSNVVGTPSSLNSLNVGYLAGSSGSYDLSGSGSLTVNGDEIIGVSGAGVFTQSGGTHTLGSQTQTSFFHLGKFAGSSGNYQLSGGDLIDYSIEEFGINGPATFVQTGGTHTVGILGRSRALTLGLGTPSSYSLSGTGVLMVYAFEKVGYFANSTFTQSGGTNTIGVPSVNGAFLDLGDFHSTATGSYNLSAGQLTVNGSENVGAGGAGTFTQTGGVHTVGTPFFARYLNIGYNNGSSYVLSGGTLNVIGVELIGGSFTQSGGSNAATATEDIGGFPGAYIHSGGTNTVGTAVVNANLEVGYIFPGSYALSGTGSLTVNGTAYIGGRSTGPGFSALFDISGGTANIDTLKIWDTGDAAPAGTRVNLSGGTLSVGNLDFTANPARFNWTGGTLNFKNGIVVDIGGTLGAAVSVGNTMTLATSGGILTNNGAITLAGGAVGGSGPLNNFGIITGNGSVGGSGNFSSWGDLIPGGIITLTGTGSNTNSGEVDVSTSNTLRLSGSPLQNIGTIHLSGGIIGGTSQLNNQSGGTITGRGTISAPLGTSGGNIAVSDGTMNISNSFTNAGVVQLGGLAATLGGGTITNTGTIQGFGNLNNAINNTTGTVEAVGGTLLLNAATSTSTGLLATSSGNKLLFTNGLAVNAGTLSLAGGTFDNNGKPLSNTGQISGYGIFRSGGLTNSGAITFAGGTTTVNGNVTNSAGKKIEVRYAPAVFTGNFTNNGIFKSTGASVTFTGTYSENGQFISDPAENFFDDVIIGSTGAWSGGVGDRFIIGGDLINGSSAKEAWETSSAELSFIGASAHTYAAAGSDLGISYAGYADNFAWARLALGLGDTLKLEGDAVYVGLLDLKGGLSQINSISGDVKIYYDLREAGNAYLKGQTYSLAGGGTISPVPESASLAGAVMMLGIMLKRRGPRMRQTAR